jgi:hypothetical protein
MFRSVRLLSTRIQLRLQAHRRLATAVKYTSSNPVAVYLQDNESKLAPKQKQAGL